MADDQDLRDAQESHQQFREGMQENRQDFVNDQNNDDDNNNDDDDD